MEANIGNSEFRFKHHDLTKFSHNIPQNGFSHIPNHRFNYPNGIPNNFNAFHVPKDYEAVQNITIGSVPERELFQEELLGEKYQRSRMKNHVEYKLNHPAYIQPRPRWLTGAPEYQPDYPNGLDRDLERKKHRNENLTVKENSTPLSELNKNQENLIEQLKKKIEEMERSFAENQERHNITQEQQLAYQDEIESMNRLLKNRDDEIERLRVRIRALENTSGYKGQTHQDGSPHDLEHENFELKQILLKKDQEIAILRNNLLRIGYNVIEETMNVGLIERISGESYEASFGRRRSLDGMGVHMDRPLGINYGYIDSLYRRPLHPTFQKFPLYGEIDDIYPKDNYIHLKDDYPNKYHNNSNKNLILAKTPDHFSRYQIVGSLKAKNIKSGRKSSSSSSSSSKKSKKDKKKH